MEIDTNIYIKVLQDQRNHFLDDITLLQAQIVTLQNELNALKAKDVPPKVE